MRILPKNLIESRNKRESRLAGLLLRRIIILDSEEFPDVLDALVLDPLGDRLVEQLEKVLDFEVVGGARLDFFAI